MPPSFLSPLHRASGRTADYLESDAGEAGLTSREGHLLGYLGSHAPVPIGELVRVFGIRQSTFTSMLDRVERAGLVRREVNPADRRSFLVHLTDAGRELAGRMSERLAALEAEVRRRVSARDIDGFHAVLRAVEDVANERRGKR
ncbi:MAG TPA: MarR family transcriptional regulator [Gemmatimonadaceae bacterium]